MIEEVRDGVILIGTAHVSATSVQTVEDTIRERKPQRVLIELDARRLEAMQDPDRWRKTDIVQVIREKKQHLFLLQLYLANMQARMGRETGVRPGGEMLAAIKAADEIGAEVVLIDRDVSITLKRGFGAMGLWQRLRLFWNIWVEVLTPTEKDEAFDVDALLETDAITAMTEEFAKFAPVVKEALIDERDAYMASHIEEEAAKGSLVAIVGAGHVPGMKRHLANKAAGVDRDALDTLPPKRFGIGMFFGYAIPAALLLTVEYLILTKKYTELQDIALAWFLINGVLSALGAAIARGHIITILTAFIAAPLTSLSPAIGAGWVAGLVEAKLRTPTVADFEGIQAIENLRQFWANGVVRVLLVAALSNLGSAIGTWVAAGRITQLLGAG